MAGSNVLTMRFRLPRLIGIAGKAGAGKDTLADYLVRQHGYEKYSLATPLKKLLNERFGWTEEDWNNRSFKESPNPNWGRHALSSVPFSPRSWAQWLGTEVGRVLGGEDVWVDMMEAHWDLLHARNAGLGKRPGESVRMVVPDVRFDNEARRIHTLGGVIIRVDRPGLEPVSNHATERGIDDTLVNVRVLNDKDVITFLREAVYALEDFPRGDP